MFLLFKRFDDLLPPSKSWYPHHDEEHDLKSSLQSAYTKNYSTETSLLHVMNNILLAEDYKKAVMLTMLDLSAAFDTIDHKMLLTRLHDCYGISVTALGCSPTLVAISSMWQYTVLPQSPCHFCMVFHKAPSWDQRPLSDIVAPSLTSSTSINWTTRFTPMTHRSTPTSVQMTLIHNS